MSTTVEPLAATSLDQIWFTRCPVPTASGLAHHLGWLTEEFSPDGIEVGVLQDAPPAIAAHHFDHQLLGLFREGGNVPALVARSEGAPTRLIGLTWIEESQAILAGADSRIGSPSDLRGARIAVPAWAGTRARSFPRAMTLSGLAGALGIAGLGWDDVELVEVPTGLERSIGEDGQVASAAAVWPGFAELEAGTVDAIYVKGARSAEHAAAVGARVVVDLDAAADPSLRVNNGTPRPITVHESLLDEHPDVVERFLTRTLRAATWARQNRDEVRDVLARETRSGPDGVDRAYGQAFHQQLAPDLSEERLALLRRQAAFLYRHGFLAEPVDVDTWVAAGPLLAAQRRAASAS